MTEKSGWPLPSTAFDPSGAAYRPPRFFVFTPLLGLEWLAFDSGGDIIGGFATGRPVL